jgi:myosin heavy subunit
MKKKKGNFCNVFLSETARDAFAMLLYGKLFDHLVSVINKGLMGASGGIDPDR